MIHRVRLLLAIALLLAATPAVRAGNGLIADHLARGYGLERAWFSHAPIDRARSRVVSATLEGDQLFVLSTAGVLQAINAETGASDWIADVGNPNYPSLGPGVSANFVAIINGSSVYVLTRDTGRIEHVKQLAGAPATGPSLNDRYVFAPLFSGRVEGFNFKQKETPPWIYASSGRVFTPMVVTESNLLWATDRGYLYVADIDAEGVRYRYETSAPVVAKPAFRDGIIYVASATGYVYAIQETSGNLLWRYATGDGITTSPSVVGDRVYVATEGPSLFSINASTGERVWESPDIVQIVAVSKTRVYGMDRLGTIAIIDAATGIVQGRLKTSADTVAVVNEQTDRLYLIGEMGLVQSLHEVGADKPTLHRAPLTTPSDADDGDTTAKPAEATPAEPDENDNLAPEKPAAPVVNPFDLPDDGGDGGDANPFDFTPTENPFGDGDGDGDGDAANPFGF